ncbi:MAG TPA: helix-hairpin-helix domain-containing protein [Legionella sp.]|nr:helix-hairpin-helix domain-containing protein [Legionella sp.]
MKAKLIAVLLSLLVSSISAQADTSTKTKKPLEKPSVTNKIDLNKADLSALTGSFKGIGKKRAEAIIEYRSSHHGFKSLEELGDIKGFGHHFVEANREKLKEVFLVG